MEDATKYTHEGACSFFIVVISWRLYKLKCKTKCDDDIKLELDGGDINV